MYKKKEIVGQVIKFHLGITKDIVQISKDLGSYDMQIRQLHHLEIISNNPGLTSSRLAEILEITKPSVTEIINKLQRLGCVYKERSSEDKRVYYIRLTEKGTKIIKARELGVRKFVEEKIHRLNDEELENLITLLDKVSK